MLRHSQKAVFCYSTFEKKRIRDDSENDLSSLTEEELYEKIQNLVTYIENNTDVKTSVAEYKEIDIDEVTSDDLREIIRNLLFMVEDSGVLN